MFARHPGLSVMSAGLAIDSDLPLDAEMLEWADRVFAMEARHRRAIEARFSPQTRRAPIVLLGVRDEYLFMQPELVGILRTRMARHLP